MVQQIGVWQGDWRIPGVPPVDRVSKWARSGDPFVASRSPTPPAVTTPADDDHNDVNDIDIREGRRRQLAHTPKAAVGPGSRPEKKRRVDQPDETLARRPPPPPGDGLRDVGIHGLLLFRSEPGLKIGIRKNGLQEKLPPDHPLLNLYRDILLMTHPGNRKCVKNHINVVCRTFRPLHWTELLTCPEPVVDFLRR